MLSQQNITIRTNGGNYIVDFAGVTNVTIDSNANRVDFSADQAAGTVTVDGNSNTVIFRPGTSVGSLIITGSANTVYIPQGSAIRVTDAPTNTTLIITYQP